MPRRNRNTRSHYTPRPTPEPERSQAQQLEAMARSLVLRGLCSDQILERRRPTEVSA